MLDNEAKDRFIQFELWKDCHNGCSFCFNKCLEDVDKAESLDFVIEKIKCGETDQFNEIGFIGGEFFDGQIEDEVVKTKFYELFDIVADLLNEGKMKKLYITSSMILHDMKSITNFFDYLSKKTDLTKVLLCTSYDTIGRFRDKSAENAWSWSMKYMKNNFPSLKLHVEMIITQDFINKVLDSSFDIRKFESDYCVTVDYLEPNTGSYYDGKEEFDKNVPNFLPHRSDFIRFLLKTCVKDKSIELFKLFSKKIRSDRIYLIVNGKRVDVCGRHKGDRWIGISDLKIKPKFGYVDSDIDMAEDVREFRSVYEQ